MIQTCTDTADTFVWSSYIKNIGAHRSTFILFTRLLQNNMYFYYYLGEIEKIPTHIIYSSLHW